PHLAVRRAGGRALSERLAGENVVEAPADVPLPQISPRRPPREVVLVVGVKLSRDIDKSLTEDGFNELALFGTLTDDVGLALFRMHVHVGARDIDVSADHQTRAALAHRARVIDQRSHE